MKPTALLLALLVGCQRSPAGHVAPEGTSFTAAPRDATSVSGAADAAPKPDGLRSPSEIGAERSAGLRARLHLTEGELGGAAGLVARASKIRAVEPDSSGEQAQLRFRYEGASKERTALKSGAVREQLGLKLRARDGCNLLYVMWRFQPEARLVVSIKANPGAVTHAECENGGYTNLRPETQTTPPPLAPGQEHELSAEIHDSVLEAKIDGQPVWRGRLPAEAARLSGPAGFRSDNVQWTLLDFQVGPPK